MPDPNKAKEISVIAKGYAELHFEVEWNGEQALDTEVEIKGRFMVEGRRRERFREELEALIDKYQI